MSVKTTGAEFKKFYSDKEWWTEGTWHEDAEVTIDGQKSDPYFDLSEVADNAIMVLESGYVTNEEDKDLGTFEGYFRKWRKHQTTAFLVVEVPLNKVDVVKAAIIATGGKVKG